MFKTEKIKRDYRNGLLDRIQTIELLCKQLRKTPGFRKGEF